MSIKLYNWKAENWQTISNGPDMATGGLTHLSIPIQVVSFVCLHWRIIIFLLVRFAKDNYSRSMGRVKGPAMLFGDFLL
jgi:hypothetical protein